MNVDDWHPIGLSHSVEAGSSAGARLLGREIVVWRDAAGGVHVWEDRCPHRGMRLSFGFVRGDHIACLYHGWQYDRGGTCQYIPAHPDLEVPKTITVPVYPVQERGGMIWTSLSDAPPPLFEEREPTVPLRSLYLDCSAEVAIATLRSVRLRPFATDGLSDMVVGRVSDTMVTVSSGPDRILVGVQAISDSRTALHLSICGWQKTYAGPAQRHFYDWAMRLRDAVERPRRSGYAASAATAAI